jgi:hypothetical protein
MGRAIGQWYCPYFRIDRSVSCLRHMAFHAASPEGRSVKETYFPNRYEGIVDTIVQNPTMINAYKAGVPGNGQPFPEGSMIVKLQWKLKKSTEAPFAVEVPDVFSQAFVMEKDSKRFAKSGGWGYAVFNYDPASDKFTADAKSPSDCGYACHTPVKAKDYIFHPYQKR